MTANAMAMAGELPHFAGREAGGIRAKARDGLRWALARPFLCLAVGFLLLLSGGGIAAPLIAGHDPNAFAGGANQAPSFDLPFGTDRLGRDIFSRVVFGARISLAASLAGVALGTAAGAVLGLVSGYRGGLLDIAVQRLVDVAIGFPQLVFLVAVVTLLGASFKTLILVLALAPI